MQKIELKNQTSSGEPLLATFSPEEGMALLNYSRGEQQVVGATSRIIGPHFGDRNPKTIPRRQDITSWPEVQAMHEEKHEDPFYNGIARYAPWKVETGENHLTAILSGKDAWNSIPLAELEGQPFIMRMDVTLTREALEIDLSVVADSDALVGLEYLFALPNGSGRLHADVWDSYLERMTEKPLPEKWRPLARNVLSLDLSEPVEAIFHPFPDRTSSDIHLETPNYQLHVRYRCKNAENCWLLHKSKGSPIVRLAPMAAKYPYRPSLTVNALHIALAIEKGSR